HELNQPLAAISIYTGGLLEMANAGRCNPSELAKALALINEEALRTGDLLREVRSWISQPKMRTAATDLDSLLESVRRICQIKLLSVGVELDVQVDQHVLLVNADASQLRHVFVNLINNAVDASQDVPIDRKRIMVDAERVGDHVEIRVGDRGHGLGDA